MELMATFRLTQYELAIYAAFSILAALWCYYRWTIRHFLRISNKIKMLPSYPIVGSSLELIGSPKQVLKNLSKYETKYCPEPLGLWIGPIFTIILSKPEDLQLTTPKPQPSFIRIDICNEVETLGKNTKYTIKYKKLIILNDPKALDKGKTYKFAHEIVGEGLITASVEKWKKDRRIIAPAFNSNVIQKFIPLFYNTNKILIKNLEGQVGKTEPFDLWDYIYAHLTDVVCQTTMGYSTNMQLDKSLEFENALNKSLKSVIKRTFKPLLHPDVVYYIYKKLTGLDKTYKSVLKLPLQIIREKKQAIERTNISNEGVPNMKEENNSGTLLDTILNSTQTSANFSENDLLYQVISIISAGGDSSSSALCFCLLLLAIHQNIQDKVYSELYDVLGDGDKIMSIDEVNKLVYLDQVFKETMRLYPTIPYVLRNLQDDVKISSGDLVLPKGTTVAISANATHHLPELYPNPWTFNPENFNQENIGKRHKYSFIPFSGGPRGCLGDKYAMLSIKIFLAMFLQNFSVHTEIDLKDIEMDYHVVTKNAGGYPVTIQSRNRSSMS